MWVLGIKSESLEEQPVPWSLLAIVIMFESRFQGHRERWPPRRVFCFALGLPSCFRVTIVPWGHIWVDV